MKRPTPVRRSQSIWGAYVRNEFESDREDHVVLLSRLQGSVWPRVFPYCVANASITALVILLRHHDVIDLSFEDQGHTFLSVLVSFLLVTRNGMAYTKYQDSVTLLNGMTKNITELVQWTVAFSRFDRSPRAKNWRMEVCRRSVVLLNSVVCVLQYGSKKTPTCNDTTLTQDERDAVMSVGGTTERTPNMLSIFLRTTIASHVNFLKTELVANKELVLLGHVHEFMLSYYKCITIATSPLPFPLVQMTRTFTFVWVFTLSFALGNDIENIIPISFMMFWITFAFIGLELVAIEMDDPYGEDPIDLDVTKMSKSVIENIYVILHDVDGQETAQDLRRLVEQPIAKQIRQEVRTYSKNYSSLHTWNRMKESADVFPSFGSNNSSNSMKTTESDDNNNNNNNNYNYTVNTNDDDSSSSNSFLSCKTSLSPNDNNSFHLPTPKGMSSIRNNGKGFERNRRTVAWEDDLDLKAYKTFDDDDDDC